MAKVCGDKPYVGRTTKGLRKIARPPRFHRLGPRIPAMGRHGVGACRRLRYNRALNKAGTGTRRMDAFCQRMVVGAATIDEVLSGAFEAAPGQKADMDLAARRLTDWCRAAAGGDRSLFHRRLARDGLAATQVLARFAEPHRLASAPAPPAWADDAVWIERALQGPHAGPEAAADLAEPYAFERLFLALVAAAEIRLWADISLRAKDNLSLSARAGLGRALLKNSQRTVRARSLRTLCSGP